LAEPTPNQDSYGALSGAAQGREKADPGTIRRGPDS